MTTTSSREAIAAKRAISAPSFGSSGPGPVFVTDTACHRILLGVQLTERPPASPPPSLRFGADERPEETRAASGCGISACCCWCLSRCVLSLGISEPEASAE
jgi:hypothetical protein